MFFFRGGACPHNALGLRFSWRRPVPFVSFAVAYLCGACPHKKLAVSLLCHCPLPLLAFAFVLVRGGSCLRNAPGLPFCVTHTPPLRCDFMETLVVFFYPPLLAIADDCRRQCGRQWTAMDGNGRQWVAMDVTQEDMSSCEARRHVFLWHKKTCLLVSQEDMFSCDTRRHVFL